MIRRGFHSALVFFSFLVFLSACSPYQKLLKSNDWKKKLEEGYKYFNKGDFEKANPLLTDALLALRGTQEAEKVTYYVAFCNFKMGDYALAAYDFKNFSDAYPISPYTEDAFFNYAKSLYFGSPKSNLEQSNTMTAINAFQLYLDHYPTTVRAEECNKYIDELKAKLEKKAIDNALLFYQILNYKSAIWAIRNVLTQYPVTKRREYLEYIIVKSAFLYAENSMESKRIERYVEAGQDYFDFKEKYPVSIYAEETKRLYDKSIVRIADIKHQEKVEEAQRRQKAVNDAIEMYSDKRYLVAIKTMESIISNYPEIKEKEKLSFLVFKSAFKYANHTDTLKKQNFTVAVDKYNNFTTAFPASKYKDEATKLYAKALEEIKKSEVQSNNK